MMNMKNVGSKTNTQSFTNEKIKNNTDPPTDRIETGPYIKRANIKQTQNVVKAALKLFQEIGGRGAGGEGNNSQQQGIKRMKNV